MKTKNKPILTFWDNVEAALFAIIFTAWTVFCYAYPREWGVYENIVDKAFAPLEWTFIWVMSMGVIGLYLVIRFKI